MDTTKAESLSPAANKVLISVWLVGFFDRFSNELSIPERTFLNMFEKIESSMSGEKRRCSFLRSEINLDAYLGSLAARIRRSVAPQRAETTITDLPS